MKKLTKLLSVFVIAGAVGTGVVASACNSHTHNYNYTDNGDGKTHTATCTDGDNEITDQLHVDGDSDNKCDLCGATIKEQGSTPVVEDKVTGVTISGGKEVAEKGTLQLTATVTVTGNAAKTVTWSSSDDDTATVDANGLVTGVKEGTVTITATSTVDTTKKADYAIEVKPEGTVITPPDELDYTTVYNNDYKTATVTDGTANTYPTAGGVYQSTNAATTDANNVQITGDTLEVIDTSSSTTYGYVRLDENQELKNVKIDLTFKVGATGGNWRILTIYDAEGKPIVYGHSDSSKNFGLSLDASTVIKGATYAKDQDIKLSLTLDLVNGKLSGTVTVGTTAIDYTGDNAISINAMSFSGIGFMTANSATDRKITVSNFVVKTADANLADLQSALGARLDAAYATYKLTGDDATYTANGSLITAAYNTGKTAITAADATVSSVGAAYTKAINDMADVLSDADMDLDTAPSYKESALQALSAYLEGKHITIEPVTIGDVTYGTDINENIGDDNWTALEGYQKKSDVDAWVVTVKALFDDVETDETVLAAIKAAAIEDVQGYESDAIEALKTDKPDFYERIQLLIRDADTTVDPAVAEGTVITAINALTAATAGNVETILANAKTSITAILQSAIETPDQTKARLVGDQNDATSLGELGVYAETEKAKLENDTNNLWAGEIDAAVSAGKTAVWAIESAVDITTAYDEATAAIDFVVAKYAAHQSIISHANEKSESLHDDALANAAKVSIQAVYENTSSYITALVAAEDDTAITSAVDEAKGAINETITNLYNTELTVGINGVDGTTSATVKYGTALKASDIDISGLVNKTVKAWHVNSATGDAYDFTTIIYDNSVTLYAEVVNATLLTGKINWKYSTNGATLPEALNGTGVTDNSSKGSIELNGNASVVVTISGSNADNYIKITLKSTGSGNWSTIGVKDSDGNYIEIVEAATGNIKKHSDKNLYAVKTETASTLTFKTVKAGEYTIFVEATTADDNGGLGAISRAARVTEIEVLDKHYEACDVIVMWGDEDIIEYHHSEKITAPVVTGLADNQNFDYWYYMNGETKVIWTDGSTLEAGEYEFIAEISTVTPVETVEVSATGDATTVAVNGSLTFTATPKDAEGNPLTGRTVSWSVGDYAYAEISKDGVLTLLEGANVGDPITVTATIGSKSGSVEITLTEALVHEASFVFANDKNAATNYATVAANTKLEDNALFEITANAAFEHIATTKGKGQVTLSDGSKVNISESSIMTTSVITHGTSAKVLTIKAKQAIELKVYLALSNNAWGDNSTGNVTYSIKHADGTTTAGTTTYELANRAVPDIKITLAEGDELEISVGVTGTKDRYAYFGGAEAKLVTGSADAE